MQIDEKDITTMNIGKKAGMVLEYLNPLIDDQKEIIVTRMKNMYREGSATEPKLFSIAGELVALDDLKNRITNKIKQADRISRKVHGTE